MALTRRAVLAGGLVAALHPRRGRAAEATFDLTAAPEGADGALGYNGASPGPMLRGAVGRSLRIHFSNKLSSPVSLAFPGSRGANAVSGFAGLARPPVDPGGALSIALAPPDPGFNLYSAYGPESAAGLFGPIVIDEPAPPVVDLDLAVIFSLRGQELWANAGAAPLKITARPAGRARVRLANATAEFVLGMAISGATAHIVAVDGQPSELFAPRGGAFPMAPGARFELMLDLPEAGGRVVFAVDGGGPALQIDTSGDPAPPRPAIAALPANPRLPAAIPLERAQQVKLTLSHAAGDGFAINGVHESGWSAKPLFKATRGSAVALTLINQTPAAQTMRLEGHVARQLHALDDGWDPYWRDGLLIGAGKTVHAAFVADNPGKWPLASASPDARAKGLASWFLVA